MPWRILGGVRVLHERGFHGVRVLPGMSPTGLCWRVSITTAANMADGRDWGRLRTEELLVRYTTGDQSRFAGGEVTDTAPLEEVAALVLAALPGTEPSQDPAYVRWYAELLDLAEQLDLLPLAYDEYLDPAGGWALGGRHEIRFPGPPDPVG